MRIPKILHLYWDRSPMSLLQTFTVLTFHRLNPDWKIVVYLIKQDLEKQTYIPSYTGRDYFPIIEPFVEFKEVDLVKEGVSLDMCAILATDNLRRKALYNEGGVYSDFDVLWLKPMRIFPYENFECTVCFYKEGTGHHSVGVTVAERGSGYLKSLIGEYDKVKFPYKHQAFGSDIDNVKYPNLAYVNKLFPRVCGVPYNVFYPYDIYDLERLYLLNDLTPLKNAVCLHWFNGHKLTKEYINENKYDRNCSMTTILKRENLFDIVKLYFDVP
jgi:hypothetical protein